MTTAAPSIQFYNSLSHGLEPFALPADRPVTIYSCGPTVYDYAHIGNFRSFLFADLIRRFLEATGAEVRHVMNITDVGHMTEDTGEDKMAQAAKKLAEKKKADKKSGTVEEGQVEDPSDPYQIARFYEDAFLQDALTLGMRLANEPENIPRATENVEGMLAMIHELLASGHAYKSEGGVIYYSVESFPEYGKLSGNTLDQLVAGQGGRVSEDEIAGKRHPADFLLWKPDTSHIMKWDSDLGTGYPGWHIECSVMARRLLGDTIDIHTGGEDLIFPHHECEIAQTRGATGEDRFASFWMHARFLMVEGAKMSKSKGNFYTVRDVLGGKVTGRDVHPGVLRYELTKSHYRANMNFTVKGLQDSAAAVRKLIEFKARLKAEAGDATAEVDNSHPAVSGFLAALGDDLNMSGALGVLFPWVGGSHPDPAESLAAFEIIDSVLCTDPSADPADGESTGGFDPTALCKQIDEARAAKDWPAADAARDELKAAGYEVRNDPSGTVAVKELA
ncbi:cysteine--tRNA ligase [Alienimonas chondri]|uniref:Cysteine--tRNA ligase n=1 Tax=Alienimonas chondri TaxID=2681879 RepID=A0ABX1VC40_9PLAN|nr:cysteine--tRNA ligase [Alienimonas chondri]NNJ25085.1 Cysteine--tRNA ligase [Alienimonas chondri]